MSRKNLRILVGGDGEIVRESLSRWLKKDGFTGAAAPAEAEAGEDGTSSSSGTGEAE